MAEQSADIYNGSQPFIFISYSHKDKKRVYPIIDALRQRGMRVWYDEELEGGHHWDRGIAEHLASCAHVLCFITKNFVVSENCLNEAYMAYTENKGPIFACLEDVDLPPEMRLNYNRVHKYPLKDYPSWDEFVDRIALTEALRPCCGDLSKLPGRKKSQPRPAPVAKPAPAKPVAANQLPARQHKSSGKGKFIAIAAAAVAVLALVLVLVIPHLGGNSDPTGDNSGDLGGSTPSGQLPTDQEGRYELAMDYIQQGKYSDAYAILEELGDYSDSASQMAAIREAAFLQQIKQAQPGDIVYWGSYEQDAVTSNGKEDIAWIVLYDDGGRKLLLSKELLDCQPYHPQQTATSWKTSELRQWLMDDFYWEAFNETEQKALFSSVTVTANSEDTRDRVFVLTMEEANLYIDLITNNPPTEYAVRQGASKDSYGWWLRDVNNGAYIMGIACMWKDKSMMNTNVDAAGIAVRPSIWVDTRTEAELEAAYNEALRLVENKNYKKAMTAFEALGDYKDSAEYYGRMPKLILMKPYAEAEVGEEVRVGNYDWIVVEKQEDKILVVSKYSIGRGDFIDAGWEITWDISGARAYLNGDFINNILNAGDEKSLILPTPVTTPANPEHGTAGGADVTDKVFLLSYEEVMRYFPDAQDRALTTEADKNTAVIWWLRTMGQDICHVVCVDAYGSILLAGEDTSPFSPVHIHLRPAMWIGITE